MPRVERLLLAVVEAVPTWHPQRATFRPFPVHAWVIRHPDGPIVVDSGVGIGHALIDEWYRPRTTPIGDALGVIGIDVTEVVALILSHLHFDHCGQQAAFDCPVYVQSAEVGAALPHAVRITLPDLGSFPAWEAPGTVNDVVSAFLRSEIQ
jgi:glyoxylase-like metal-dependent hydrolase (beta-lactamase superfamily II)